MNTHKYKKIGLGLGFVLAVLAFSLSVFSSHKALAAVPPTQTSGTASQQTYLDSCVERIGSSSGGGTWCQFFNDGVPDTTMLYGNGATGDAAYSVDTIVNSVNYQISTETQTVGGTVVPARITIVNSQGAAFGSLGDSNLIPSGTFYSTGAPYTKVTYYLYTPESSGDTRYVLLLALHTDGTPPLILALVDKTVYKAPSAFPNGNGVVYAYKINKNAVISTPGGAAAVGGTAQKGDPCTGGADCQGGVCTKSGGDCTSSTSASCDTNFNNPFSWIICPAMGLADDAAGQFNTFVQQQLCFNTGDSNPNLAGEQSSTGGVVCSSSNNNLTTGVHNAWSIFRNIASALLVIVLLVVVISQAIGGGPLDAYTIRKMLPKIVIAVIAMQLSWVLLKWLIDLSNDAGSAINSLMLAPFGGTGHITLSNLTGGYDLSNQNAAVTTGVFVFSFFAGLAALAIVSVPGLLLLALYVVLALLTAFVVLLLRKMLIIFLIILAPVALILWILPGTERYWKTWSSNMSKLLLMFPMIMGLVAAGKIFATIASGNTAVIFHTHLGIAHLGALPIPYLAKISDFVDLAIILGAWFAPYFLLPQTFKWGGAALGAASKGVASMTERAGKPAREYLNWRQGLSPWKQARAARRAEVERRSKIGFAEGLQEGGTWGRIHRARLGGVGPRGREAAVRGTIAARAGEALETEMLPQVRKENTDHLNGYLLTQNMRGTVEQRVDAAVARANAGRARMGLPLVTAPERAEMITNFRRFDTNGWRGNRVFASTAVQATGAAGSLDNAAESAAQAVYIGNRTGEDREEAAARFGAIRFQAHVAARGSGQYAADRDSLGGIAINPAGLEEDPDRNNAEWRRVSDLGSVSFGSMGGVIGGTTPDTGRPGEGTGFTHAVLRQVRDDAADVAAGRAPTRVEGLHGIPLHTYSYIANGRTINYNGIRFSDSQIQNFMNQVARVRSGDVRLDQRQRQQFDLEYASMMTQLGPDAPAVEATIAEKARHRHFTD